MYFEVLVEDISGKRALEILIPKIIDNNAHIIKIREHKGIGHIPKDIKTAVGTKQRLLLNKLPFMLQAYGKTFANYPAAFPAVVIVVCDLDRNDQTTFYNSLLDILRKCNPKPQTRFCLAIEEGEAWFLGDIPAIKAAYPKAKDSVLNDYANDSICGTWELMADAVYPGGRKSLVAKGRQAVGAEKSQWAVKIAPHMDVDSNLSPSFNNFKTELENLAKTHI